MNHSHHHDEHPHLIPENKKAYCPISGDAVDIDVAEHESRVREYNGKKVYFCCTGCVEEFDKQPEEYIAH